VEKWTLLTEVEEKTKMNTKDTKKIVEATIIIKKTGKVIKVVIRNSKKTKLNINPIMKIINLIKIVMKMRLLKNSLASN
jgi:peroxiredoxin